MLHFIIIPSVLKYIYEIKSLSSLPFEELYTKIFIDCNNANYYVNLPFFSNNFLILCKCKINMNSMNFI